eukprot:jgi/Picsp_1/90/NSC_00090-R1_protein
MADSSDAEVPSHPTALIFLIAFKAAAMVKNVSGRLMVGLRWWNEVSDTGGNEWKFESLQEGQRGVNKYDSRMFWAVLYATPAVWVLLGIVAFLKLNVDYLLLVVIAILLSGANLVGYFKCSKAAQNQLKGLRSELFAQGIKAYFRGG